MAYTEVSKMQKKKEPHVLKRIICDAVASMMSGFSVAPFVTIIDKGITQNASGAKNLWKSIGLSIQFLLKHPLQFFSKPEYRWIYSVYTSTYLSANLISSLCSAYNINPDLPKFIGVSATNITMSILKDRAFAKLFGTKVPESVPIQSLGCWMTRDCLTILFSFIVPARLALYFQREFKMAKKKSEVICQLFCPVFLQIFSTPLHLLGLDLYNNKVSLFQQRVQFVKREYVKSVAARMMRIFPAFGLGGICNGIYRDYLHKQIRENENK